MSCFLTEKPKGDDGVEEGKITEEGKTTVDETSDIMPTGRVVGIIQRNWREYVACFAQTEVVKGLTHTCVYFQLLINILSHDLASESDINRESPDQFENQIKPRVYVRHITHSSKYEKAPFC